MAMKPMPISRLSRPVRHPPKIQPAMNPTSTTSMDPPRLIGFAIRSLGTGVNDRLPAEHERLGDLVGIGPLIPIFEPRIAVVQVVAPIGGEHRHHEVLNRSIPSDGADVEPREGRHHELASGMEVVPDRLFHLAKAALEPIGLISANVQHDSHRLHALAPFLPAVSISCDSDAPLGEPSPGATPRRGS